MNPLIILKRCDENGGTQKRKMFPSKEKFHKRRNYLRKVESIYLKPAKSVYQIMTQGQNLTQYWNSVQVKKVKR